MKMQHTNEYLRRIVLGLNPHWNEEVVLSWSRPQLYAIYIKVCQKRVREVEKELAGPLLK